MVAWTKEQDVIATSRSTWQKETKPETVTLLSDSKTARRGFGSLPATYVEGSYVHTEIHAVIPTEEVIHAVGVVGAPLFTRTVTVPDN